MPLTQAELLELSSLVDQVQALPQEARAAWLANLTLEQAAFRPTLDRLLKSDAKVETADFLSTLPKLDEAIAADAGSLAAGVEIGPYRLIRELGHGGMGMVWLAERSDGVLKRTVALKLPHSALPQRQLAERFARERDILAALTHPNIARLYDAGVTPQGQPYLALEYVEGEPLLASCDRHQLGVRKRIELYLQVLAAVQYAHAQLVVHRDLKPSNILVTNEGEVRLLDFGIAKLLIEGEAKETELTQLGGRAMTPQYASPEQIAGQAIGTASDVYTLGVVLYELLTGSPPYKVKRDSRGALEDAILTSEPARPSTVVDDPVKATARATTVRRLHNDLTGDLDIILLKPLKKDPGERYGTVDAFAADLRRHLIGEPVLARPDSVWYRASRFAGRNRLAVSSAAVVVIALAVGFGVALWQTRQARYEAQRARAAQMFMQEIFTANSNDGVDPEKARNRTARELLDIASSKLDTALADAPEAKLSILRTLNDVYDYLGLQEARMAVAQRAVDLARALRGTDDEVVAEYLVKLGLAQAGPTGAGADAALASLGQAERILDRVGDRTSRTRALLEMEVSTLLDITKGESDATAARLDRAIAILRTFGPSEELIGALANKADFGFFGGKRNPEAARDAAMEGAALADSLGGNARKSLPSIYQSLARAQRDLQDLRGADQAYRRAYQVAKDLKRESPTQIIAAAYDLSRFLRQTSRSGEAVSLYESDPFLQTDAPGLQPGDVDAIRGPRGEALVEYGRFEDGLRQADAMIAELKPSAKAQGIELALVTRANALIELRRWPEAQATLADGFPDLAHAHRVVMESVSMARARLALSKGRAAEAMAILAPLRSAEHRPGKISPNRLDLHVLQAEGHALLGEADQAIALCRDIVQRTSAHPDRLFFADSEARARLLLGTLLRASAPLEAAQLLDEALKLAAAAHDPQRHPLVAAIAVALAQVERDLGRRDRAVQLLARAKAIHARHATLANSHRGQLEQTRLADRSGSVKP